MFTTSIITDTVHFMIGVVLVWYWCGILECSIYS